MRRHLPWIVGVALLVGIGLIVWTTRTMTPAPESLDADTGADTTGRHEASDAGDAGDATPSTPGASAPVDLAFEPLSFEAAQTSLDALVAEARVEPDSVDARQLLQASERLGLVETLRLPGLSRERASERFVAAAVDAYTRYGRPGFAAIGEQGWQRFAQALDTRAHPAGRLPADATGSDLDAARAGVLAAELGALAWRRTWLELTWLGDFPTLAEHEGLLDARGAIADEHLPLVRLMFRWMWARRLEGAIPVERLLTADEVVAMRRWQIERSSRPVEARLALAESVREPLGELYDVDRAIAVLRASQGEIEAARAALERSLARAERRGDVSLADEIRTLQGQLAP